MIKQKKSCLGRLLIPLFKELEDKKLAYAVCGNYKELPYYTNHDVDIWVSSAALFDEYLLNIASNNGFVVFIRNKTSNGINYAFYIETENGKQKMVLSM